MTLGRPALAARNAGMLILVYFACWALWIALRAFGLQMGLQGEDSLVVVAQSLLALSLIPVLPQVVVVVLVSVFTRGRWRTATRLVTACLLALMSLGLVLFSADAPFVIPNTCFHVVFALFFMRLPSETGATATAARRSAPPLRDEEPDNGR